MRNSKKKTKRIRMDKLTKLQFGSADDELLSRFSFFLKSCGGHCLIGDVNTHTHTHICTVNIYISEYVIC
jgi:hypothetical protein